MRLPSSSRYLAVLPAAAALLAGCGGSDGGSASGSDADPASVLPKGSPLYFEAVVQPEGDQEEQLRSFLSKVLRTDDPGAKIKAELDKAIQEEEPGRSFDKDVEPWLGERIGVTVTDLAAPEPGFLMAIGTKDTDAATSFLSEVAKEENQPKKSYEGTDYYVDADDDTVSGVVGDFIVVSDGEAAFKRAVDTPEDDGLDDSEAFDDAIGDLPDERLGTFYMDPKVLGEAAVAGADDPAAAGAAQNILDGLTAVTGFAEATEDTATFETRTVLAEEGVGKDLAELGAGAAPELLESLPGDSWAAVGIGNLGQAIRTGVESAAGGIGTAVLGQQLEQQIGINLDRDVLSWIGDVAVFVRGDSVAQIGGGLVIQATDEQAAGDALPRLVAAASRTGLTFQDLQMGDADQAYAATVPGAPGPVVLARSGDRVVMAIGDDAAADALDPSDTLGDAPLFDRAESALDGVSPTMVLDGPTMVKLLSEGAGSDPDFAQAKPYLDMIDLMAAGAAQDDDTLRQRFTAKLK